MSTPSRLAEDLHYVRGLLDRPTRTPASILLLWALLGAPGFALVDLAPAAVPWYWLVVAPLGLLASIWLGRRAALRMGHDDPATGRRWVWHWSGLLAAALVVVLLAVSGVLPTRAINPAIVLLIATAYFLAGVHLDRRLLWIAAALAATFPLVAMLPRYGWTAAGALVALVTLVVALAPARSARV